MSYDRDSFLAGLAVGRTLWRPHSIVSGDIGFRLEGYPKNNLPITFEPIGSYETELYEISSGNAYAIVGYPNRENQRYGILFWGYSPFQIRNTTTYRQGGTYISYLDAHKSEDTIYYIVITASIGGYNNQSFSGNTITRAEYDYILSNI